MFGKKDPDELVWVDDGVGDVVAAYGTEYGQTVWMRKPTQVKKSAVTISMRVLDGTMLSLYNKCITEVEERKKKTQKGKDAT